MAKIKTLQYEVKGVEYKINVNCTSKGIFTANIPKDIADALVIDNRIELAKLEEVENLIAAAFNAYRDANTSEELYIIIKYGAGGAFNAKSNGDRLFFNNDNSNDYGLSSSWGKIVNVLGFDYKVVIKLTVDGKTSWYTTRFGYKRLMSNSEETEEKTYHKASNLWDVNKYKVIPYSEEALSTLTKIEEGMRAASETLFNFVEMDENKIQSFLESGNINLLGQRTE